MIRTLKRAAAAVLTAAIMITASACGEEPVVGNLGEVALEENDMYAVIDIRDYGEITAKLFHGAAPNAVDRFVEYADRGYYDGTTIHRVIDEYVIQGGSLNGDGSDGKVPDSLYIPVETSPVTFNFYGALCLAASKKGCYAQFYIVDNDQPQDIDAVIEKLTEQLGNEEISARLLEEDKKKYQDYLDKLKAIPEEVKEKYKRVGGLYDLDGTSTVFGQVIDGFDVLKKITSVEVVSGNKSDDKQDMPSKPLESIIIDSIKIIKIEPEVSEETTTTKKTVKAKKSTDDEVNAETLPTPASEEDTTAPAEGAENENAADSDTLQAADEAGSDIQAPETDDETVLPAYEEDSVPDDEDEIVIIED